MQITDLLGNEVVIGDRVAGAFRTGNTAEMRVGVVLGFGERGNNVTVQVRWEKSSLRGPNAHIIGGIEADLKRFVKIGD